MKEDLIRISRLAEENLTRGIRLVESRDGAPAAEIIYQDEGVTIAWPARLAWRGAWDYTIDPVLPGSSYKEYRDRILFLYPNGKTEVLAVAAVPQGMKYFPSQESWLETMAWLMEKAGFSGPKQALKATLLLLDNDLDISL